MATYCMASLAKTVAETVIPVSVTDLKTHLQRATATAPDDAALADWIWAAAEAWQRATGHQLTQATYRYSLDGVPDAKGASAVWIKLPRYPVASITSVQVQDSSGVWQTITGTTVDNDAVPARVYVPTANFPTSLYTQGGPVLRIVFVAGTTTAAAIDRRAVQAVKLLAAHWYRNREAYSPDSNNDVPQGWAALTAQFWLGCSYPLNDEGGV